MNRPTVREVLTTIDAELALLRDAIDQEILRARALAKASCALRRDLGLPRSTDVEWALDLPSLDQKRRAG